jgi:hypothetical protein
LAGLEMVRWAGFGVDVGKWCEQVEDLFFHKQNL